MKTKKTIKSTSSDLSTISSKFEFHSDETTNHLIILIELEYPQFLTAYIDVIENFVKFYGKNYNINDFHTVRDWKSVNMWVFNTNLPMDLVV